MTTHSTPDPIHRVLDLLPDAKVCAPGEWKARCPAHDDTNPSLSIAVGDNGTVLLHCFAGCPTEVVLQKLGLSMRDLFPTERCARDGHTPPPRSAAAPANTGPRVIKSEPAGDAMQFPYLDEQGNLLFQVVRIPFIETLDNGETRRKKKIWQRRPDGRGGWINNLQSTRRVLYRLPELIAADPSMPVYIVEGEGKVDRLRALGLVATCSSQGAGKWDKTDPPCLQHFAGRIIVVVPDRDIPGRAHAEMVAMSLVGKAASIRIVELPGLAEKGDIIDWLDAGGTVARLTELVEAAPFWKPASEQDRSPQNPHGAPGACPWSRPQIVLDHEEHRAIDEAVEAMASDPDLYQRGRMLVRVIREDGGVRDGVKRPRGSITIVPIATATLRERTSKHAELVRLNKKGELVPAHPPGWLVNGVEARGFWQGVRTLAGISDVPVLRLDGTVCQIPGYDEESTVLFDPAREFPPVPTSPTRDNAWAAVERLFEIVCDFRFRSEAHRSAWLAALLTPLARAAFWGPAPLFLVDANIRGAGKGLLCQTIGHVALGRAMPISAYTQDDDEMRKRITSIAIAGDPVVLLDNIDGRFGNPALDAALTGTHWNDRLWGHNTIVSLPMNTVWFATGNNVQVAADMIRRIVHIRLEVMEKNPEDRGGFKHPNLLRYVQAQRPELVVAGLTILSAFCRAGRPAQDLKPLGSFEGWSDLVRGAVVGCGQADPCESRRELAATADTSKESLSQLIEALQAWPGIEDGIVIAYAVARLYPGQGVPPSDLASVALRVAFEALVNAPPGRIPSAKQIGARLRHFRKQVVDSV